MTEADVEKIIKSNMILQMNLAGIRAEFEEKLQRDQVLEEAAALCEQMWHKWLDSPEENEPNKPDAEDCYRAIRGLKR